MLSKITIGLFITCLVGPAIIIFVFAFAMIHVIDWESTYSINALIMKWSAIIGSAAALSQILETTISGIELYKLEHED